MMLVVEYAFYRLYKFALRTERHWGRGGAPVWIAIFTLSILFFFNLFSALIIYKSLTKDSILPDTLNPIVGIITALILYVLGYYLFDYNKKHLKIEKSFDVISESKKKIYNILFWLYIIITLSVMFIIIIIPMNIVPAMSR